METVSVATELEEDALAEAADAGPALLAEVDPDEAEVAPTFDALPAAIAARGLTRSGPCGMRTRGSARMRNGLDLDMVVLKR